MPQCDRQLDANLESPAQPLGRVTVKVRCNGSSPWTVFVPAQVRLFRNVVTVVRPLKRESIVGEQDVSLRERDVGALNQGFLSDLEQAIGLKVIRPTVMDQVLTLNTWNRPKWSARVIRWSSPPAAARSVYACQAKP